MKEIINIFCGQCGNEIGSKYMETKSYDHGMNQKGHYTGKFHEELEQVNVFFNEMEQGKFKSRTILIDADTRILNQIQCKPGFELYRQDNFIHTKGGTENNWAKGYYIRGNEIIDRTMDVIRHETEKCDSLQGFSLINCVGGGTGSGLGSLITQMIKQEYSDSIIQTFTILPSLKQTCPYNTILGMSSLIEYSDLCVIFDHEVMHEICYRKQKIVTPSFGDINYLATTAMVSFTSHFRFNTGQRQQNLQVMASNLIPFPNTNLLSMSYSLMFARGASSQYHMHPIKKLISFLYDSKYSLSTNDLNKGKYLAQSILCRGKISPEQIIQEIEIIKIQNKDKFIEWIPNNFSITFLEFQLKAQHQQLANIANNTSISYSIQRAQESLINLLRKRTYLYRYLNEGKILIKKRFGS